MATTTKFEIRITTHDPEADELGTDGDDDDNNSSSLVQITGPRNGGSGSASATADTYVHARDVFNTDGAIVFTRGHVRVTLMPYGTLPDGRVLLTIAEALPLPTFEPRPGDQGA